MRIATAAMILLGVTAQAHHSLDATYDLKKEVRLDGRILQVLVRNPHSYLVVEALDKDGINQRWALEWLSAKSLGKQDIKSGTLKAGDAVAITLHPPRKASETRGALEAIHRESDGFQWSEKARKSH